MNVPYAFQKRHRPVRERVVSVQVMMIFAKRNLMFLTDSIALLPPMKSRKAVDTGYKCHRLVQSEFGFAEQLASDVRFRDSIGVKTVTCRPGCPSACNAILILARLVATCDPVPPAPIMKTVTGWWGLSRYLSV